MPRVNFAEDIVPLSSFRSDVTRLMTQTRTTHRPVVVTQNGRASTVFLDVNDYQELLDKADLAMELYKGEQDIQAGRVLSSGEVRESVLSSLGI
ncbi:MAG: type II toxin-antitoxin system Phd/YefM family antitoxin [Kiritimatiellae bacterium]|nr:type II toxin-antitoxin system Phd/YefM family antitoxin [Kiritimatiellia bacterium]